MLAFRGIIGAFSTMKIISYGGNHASRVGSPGMPSREATNPILHIRDSSPTSWTVICVVEGCGSMYGGIWKHNMGFSTANLWAGGFGR